MVLCGGVEGVEVGQKRGMGVVFLEGFFRVSRNLVGIAIQLSDSEEKELFVHDSMQVSPE